MIKHISLAIAVLFAFALQAQQSIELKNPSFESFPRHGYAPKGWYDCGFPNETPPDVHPSMAGGEFKVTQPSQDQATYLGMVVRDNETWESVSQRLIQPLQKGKCYTFSIYLSRSLIYKSVSRVTEEEANYATPCRLRIWAGNAYCDKAFLLAESKEVINTRWLKKTFRFEPDDDYYHIQFEAFYKTPLLTAYNGNILLDNASEIMVIPCDEDEPIIATIDNIEDDPIDTAPPIVVSDPPKTEQVKKGTTPSPTPPKPTPSPLKETTPTSSTSTIAGLKRSEMKTGTEIRLDRVYFAADKADIRESSHEALDEIYTFLKENEDVIIEVGGHTNSIPAHDFCDRLSTARAKAVAEYLMDKGIDEDQIQYKGYGKRKLLVKNERNIMDRRKNQRVEIKILSMDS
ncbi:MAG: OmpA family protein [Bacteroidota bacterium]